MVGWASEDLVASPLLVSYVFCDLTELQGAEQFQVAEQFSAGEELCSNNSS